MAGLYLYVCPGRSTLITYPNNNDRYNPVHISSWEFVTNLDYEWSVIRGHRPFRWTICVSIKVLFLLSLGPGAKLVYPIWQIYIITRIFTLIAIILTLMGMDDTARYDCEVRMFLIRCFICGCDLIGHDSKLRIVFQVVSEPFRCTY